MVEFHFELSREGFAAVKTALESACRALSFAYHNGAVDEKTRAWLAGSILEHASTGVHCPVLLSAHALGKLQPQKAAYMQMPQAIDLGIAN
jgi:hypothetical protein